MANVQIGVLDIDTKPALQHTGQLSDSLIGLDGELKHIASTVSSGLGTSNPFASVTHGAQAAGESIKHGVGDALRQTEQQFHSAESASHGFFENFKHKSGEMTTLLGAGALAGAGAAFGIERLFEAGERKLQKLEDLNIVLHTTAKSEEEFKVAQQSSLAIVDKLHEKYAVSKGDLIEQQKAIAGIGGVTGPQKEKISELAVAFDKLGVPARALKGLIRGAADPESVAALDQITLKFPALKEAIGSASDAGGKIDAIFKQLGPTMGAMQEAADGPLGQMERTKQAFSAVESSAGTLLVNALAPLAPMLRVVGDALGAVTKFVSDNKTAVEIAVGAYLAFRAAAAIKEAGGIVSALTSGTKAAISFAQSILTKVIPGLGAKAVAEEAGAVATGTASTAQWGLNAAISANPIGLIILGIGLFIGVLAFLYNKVEFVHDAVDKLWNILKKGINVVGSLLGLGKAFDDVGDKAKAEGDAAEGAGEKAKTGAELAAEAQKELAAEVKAATDAFDAQKEGLDTNVKYLEKQIATQLDTVRQNKEILKSRKDISEEDRQAALNNIAAAETNVKTLQKVGQQRFKNLEAAKKEEELGKSLIEGGKEAVDLFEQRQRIEYDELKLALLRQNFGKLTVADELRLLNLEVQHAQALAEHVKATEKAAKTEKERLDAHTKVVESEIKVQELLGKVNELSQKVNDEWFKIQSSINASGISFEKLLANSVAAQETLEGVRLKAKIIADEFEDAGAQIETVLENLAGSNSASEAVTRTVFAIREGIQNGVKPAELQLLHDRLAQEEILINATRLANGQKLVDYKALNDSIDKLLTAGNAAEQEALHKREEEYKNYTDRVTDLQKNFETLFSALGLSEIAQIQANHKIAMEALEERRKKAADDTKALAALKIEQDKLELESARKLAIAKFNEEKKYTDQFAQIAGSGFQKAFDLAHSKFLAPLHKALDADNNFFGALLDTIIDGLFKMGEQLAANAIAGSISRALATAETEAMVAAVLPGLTAAALNASIFSFGSADATGLGAYIDAMATAQGLSLITGRALGGRETQPTLTLLAESGIPEIIFPEPTGEKVLSEMANKALAGASGGLSVADIAEGVRVGNMNSPSQTVLTGYQLSRIAKRTNARAIARGASPSKN